MKPIVVWERWNPKTEKWEHNHIDDKRVAENQTHPVGDEEQTKIWQKQKWRHYLAYLQQDGTVIRADDIDLDRMRAAAEITEHMFKGEDYLFFSFNKKNAINVDEETGALPVIVISSLKKSDLLGFLFILLEGLSKEDEIREKVLKHFGLSTEVH